jgi:formylmethanofuran dehydrogenase subunit E
MQDLDTLLKGAAKAHGHICPGQVVGVRMAMLGCSLIGLDNPSSREQIKKIIVYVEMDRCATDAIAHVTGVRLGRRSLKFIDNGIMAATFVNLETNKAVRIVSTETARELAPALMPEIEDPREQQLEAYKIMDTKDLFTITRVRVDIPAGDMPGPTQFKAVCEECGIVVRDKKEIYKNNRILCRPCALESYFQPEKGDSHGQRKNHTV